MSGYYNEIPTCPVCEVRVDASSQNYKFVIVEGTTSRISDERPTEVPSTAVSSDGPYLVLVHERCLEEFVRRVSARIWPPSN